MKGVIPIAKRYNTPHRSHVVKTRMTEEEYADFTGRLEHYDISQAEFIRQAITRATIRPIVTVSPVNDELLAAVGKLTAEYGKIGGNLNQIARALNEYGAPYNTLSGEVRAAIADLAALKFEVLRKVGEAVGDIRDIDLSFSSFRNKHIFCSAFLHTHGILSQSSHCKVLPDIFPHFYAPRSDDVFGQYNDFAP